MVAMDQHKAYQLRTCDFDQYGHIQPASVLDIFQDIASTHADDMGIGFDDMQAQGVFWAVTRMKYEVVKHPVVHGEYVARTWPHSPSRFSFKRDYSLKDADGELCVKASSEWVLMDVESRQLAKVADHYNGPDNYFDDRSFADKMRKIVDVDMTGTEPYELVPGASDIDVNGHLNNARYAAYVLDALNLGADQVIKTFQIDYRHEVKAGEPLRLYSATDAESVIVKGLNAQDESAFLCKIELA